MKLDADLALLTGGKGPFVAGTGFDLSTVGYEQAEYSITGVADAYERSPDGLRTVEEAPFQTRLLVYRPRDAATFNGTVWVEWLNVSGGLDAAPAWILAHTELVRAGAAWVGLSAQKVGVEGGEGLISMPGLSLLSVDPVRYEGLHHPGDRFSYDIFTQAAFAVRWSKDNILGDLEVERVLGFGDSQSAFRLTTYVNDVDPLVRAYDGFVVNSRGGAAAPLDDLGSPVRNVRGDPVEFRADLRVPVLCVEAETDLITLAYLSARQSDTEMLVTWEIAGTAHADIYTFVAGRSDTGLLPIEDLARMWRPVSNPLGMNFEKPVNTGPQHWVRNASVSHLDRWVRDGSRPPESKRLQIADGSFVTDEIGNVLGGIRTPAVDVPTTVLSGLGNGGNPVAFLAGTTLPLGADKLRSLYGSKDDYAEKFAESANAAESAGFVLADDLESMKGIAEALWPS